MSCSETSNSSPCKKPFADAAKTVSVKGFEDIGRVKKHSGLLLYSKVTLYDLKTKDNDAKTITLIVRAAADDISSACGGSNKLF